MSFIYWKPRGVPVRFGGLRNLRAALSWGARYQPFPAQSPGEIQRVDPLLDLRNIHDGVLESRIGGSICWILPGSEKDVL